MTQRYIEAVESDIITKLRSQRTENYSNMLSSPPLVPCNTDRMRKAITNHLHIRRLATPDVSCITDYIGSSTSTSLTAKNIYEGIRRRGKSLFDQRDRINQATVGNWTHPDAPYDFDYRTDTVRCTINYGAGIRLQQKWYLVTYVTSHNGRFNLPRNGRMSVTEYLHILPNGTLDNALHMSIAIRPPDGSGDIDHVLEPNTTTVLSRRDGAKYPSYFGRLRYEDIPALQEGLDMMELQMQSANDALSASSISILVLPLFLTLFPLAAFGISDSSGGGVRLILYTLLTDVVTIMPLAIKGLELTIIGSRKKYAASARVSTAINGSFANAAGAHVWAVECGPKKKLLLYGEVFIYAAMTSMVIGIGLEIVGRCYATRIFRQAATVRDVEDVNNSHLDEQRFEEQEYDQSEPEVDEGIRVSVYDKSDEESEENDDEVRMENLFR